MANLTKNWISKEILFHFNCSACKLWWSIGDANYEGKVDPYKHQWYCPWCGHKQEQE